VLGTLSIGVLLDERLADQLKHATQSEVAFALNNQVRAATLPRTSWTSLLSLADKSAATSIRVADAEYVGWRCLRCRRKRACRGQRSVAATFVLQSRTERLRFCAPWRRAHHCRDCGRPAGHGPELRGGADVTRPLGAITNTMREVAVTGDLTRKITLRGRPSGRTRTRACWRRPTTAHRLHRAVPARGAQKEQLLSLGRCPR
jgi:hypothetical protein